MRGSVRAVRPDSGRQPAVLLEISGGTELSRDPICIADGDISTRDTVIARLMRNAGLESLQQRALEIWDVARANLVLVDESGGTCLVASHPSGAFPLLYTEARDSIRFGSQLSDVIDASSSVTPDWAGVASVLRTGYFLNGRTVVSNVRRLQPGQALVIRSVGSSVSHSLIELSRLWVLEEGATRSGPSEVELEAIWQQLILAIDRGVQGGDGPTALMMSGGWDSRTLLAALTTSGQARNLVAYSHGDIKSRELALVDRLARASGASPHLEPIDVRSFDMYTLKDQIRITGEAFFPHWFRSGSVLRSKGIASAFSGVLGEVLGGHYGVAMMARGVHKATLVAAYALGISRLASGREVSATSILSRGAARPWFIDDAAWALLRAGFGQIAADVEAEIDRLRLRGVQGEGNLFEAAISELRGGQFICAQPRSLLPSVEISIPFADLNLLKRVAAIPMTFRVHNLLNRRLLKRFAPQLMRFPTAATYVPASAPVLIQEVGRAARWAAGRAREGAYRRSGFDPDRRPHYSWVDVEFARRDGTIERLIEGLTSSLWDRPALLRAAARAKTREGPTSMHPLVDVMCRIATVDGMLGL